MSPVAVYPETLLAELRQPGWSTENADLTDAAMAHSYAQRDMELSPGKTVGEWRSEIDALLSGPPYGKMHGTEEFAVAMAQWRESIANLPPSTHPETIYAQAPISALVYLGW